jgi:ferrous-iron efflux pump FieF
MTLTYQQLRHWATYASVSVATILIIGKLAAYLLTGSIAILTSLVDSTVDLLASLVTMLGVASAMKPPDRNHRFGHGKAEALAALAQAAFIVGSCVILGYEAISRFYKPQPVENTIFGYWVTALAIVLTLLLLAFQRYVVRRTGSMAIEADRMHYVGDLLVNVVVIITLVLQDVLQIHWLDPLFALGIAVVLSGSAWRVARNALNVLMDRELSDQDREKILAVVRQHPRVTGIHDLRTRSDGERAFVNFHLELDGATSLSVAFAITTEIRAMIQQHFAEADVMIHLDPAGLEEMRGDTLIEQASRRSV